MVEPVFGCFKLKNHTDSLTNFRHLTSFYQVIIIYNYIQKNYHDKIKKEIQTLRLKRLYSLYQENRSIACAHADTCLILSRRTVPRMRQTYDIPSFPDHYLTLLHIFHNLLFSSRLD